MRTIKRYSNRKLYDTEAKRYITLEAIAELIRQGYDVEVIDNDSGEDLTAVTLTQIILEQQKRGSSALRGLFTNVIRFGGNSPLDLMRRSFYLPSNVFSLIEKEVERRLRELVEQGEMAEEQMRALLSDLMARFHEPERHQRERERDESPLGKLNLPTHADLQELSQQIRALTDRLDELIATKQVESSAPDEQSPAGNQVRQGEEEGAR